MITSLLFSITSAGSLQFDEKKRDPGNDFYTKLDHWPLTVPGHAHGSGPTGRNQSLRRPRLK